MALPNTGAISASMINVELNKSPSASFSLNAPDVRALAVKPTGQVKFSDFYGKSSELFEAVTMVAGYSPSGSVVVKDTVYYPDKIGFNSTTAFNFSGAFGSISPATFRGITIASLSEAHGISGRSGAGRYQEDSFTFSINSNTITSTFLKKIQIFLGATLVLELQASAATFSVVAGTVYADWRWTIPASWYLVNGNTYTVRLIYG